MRIPVARAAVATLLVAPFLALGTGGAGTAEDGYRSGALWTAAKQAR